MSTLLRFFLGDFFGTAVLILLGNGVNAAMLYNKMFAKATKGIKWVEISFGWGIAVLLGLIIANSFSGASHINPALTVLFIIKGDITAVQFVVLLVAQMLGAMFGQIVLDLIIYRHIKSTDWSLVRSCHCTVPTYPKSIFINFGKEFVGTAVLLGAILSLSLGANTVLEPVGPVVVMWIVVSIGFSIITTTGAGINPARDLGPRIIYFLIPSKLKNQPKLSTSWSYSWIPTVAPTAAAVVLGLCARFIVL